MLRVRPSSKAHPAVVFIVNIVEDEDETFGSIVFAGAEFTGIMIAVDDILLNTKRSILMPNLPNHIALFLPVTINEIHLLIGLECGASVPSSESHTVLFRGQRFANLALIGIVLHHLHYLGT